MLLSHSSVGRAQTSCDEWQAEFISVEGSVEVQRFEQSSWVAATQGEMLCTGDSVRVLAYARAMIRMPDQSMLRLDEHTSLTFSESEDDTGSWLNLLRGAIHVISRDPRALKFFTPYLNAGLEGTEFLIRVSDDDAQVAVLEGKVAVTNPNGQIEVASGSIASARAAQAPSSTPISEPVKYSRWASYYPSILDVELPAAEQAPTRNQATDPDFYAARAARRLSYGRLDGAQMDLAMALSLAPQSANARAVQSIAALVGNDKATALALAQQAVALAPDAATPLIALSYAQQAAADLDGAATSLRQAIEREPLNATAWARLAEAELANGDFAAGVAAAEHAAALRPTLAHAYSVLGFANLGRLDPHRAGEAFSTAVTLDQASPLPRLGLALALMQQGNLVEGREQLEIAVILDPANAVTRSYMAKTYDAENRSALTQTQLTLAKGFDPTDPTSWFYSSLHERNSNRPVTAFHELQTAIQLNDNQAVYRSSLMIDEDLASRSVGLGRLHRALGFEELALLQGRKSIVADPTDYSGHRLLADVYSTLPRHEIARVNSLFQAQMLQRINLMPIQPQFAEANLFILDEAGPSELASDEFSPLLSANGLRLQGSAVRGANNTVGEEAAIAGLHDRLSYSVGRFHFATDGFRENNDLDQTVTNAFIQFRPRYGTSLQAELRSTETASGHLVMLFDPTRFEPDLRQAEMVDSLRLGLRHDVSARGTVLASLVYQDVDAMADAGDTFGLVGTGDGYSADIEHIHHGERWQVSSGFTYVQQNRLDTIRQSPPFEALVSARYELQQTTGYIYASLAANDSLTLTLGASADVLESRDAKKDAVNPKIGVIWEPTARTTVRAAAFRTLQGGMSTSQQNIQPRLEPLHVAGFNQFFHASAAEQATLAGVAIDHGFTQNVFAGAEVSRRDVTTPVTATAAPVPDVNVDEDLQRAYLYWTPIAPLALSAEYRDEQFDNNGAIFLGYSAMEIRRLPFEARYFHPSGFTAGMRASRIEETGNFESTFAPGETVEFARDRFWIFDASFGYRLPKRRGMLSLNIDNLLDEDFRFQDSDPLNPSIPPERMAYFRFTVAVE